MAEVGKELQVYLLPSLPKQSHPEQGAQNQVAPEDLQGEDSTGNLSYTGNLNLRGGESTL